MDAISYFQNPQSTQQKHYEALRAFYVDAKSSLEVAAKFGFTKAYFKKLCSSFSAQIRTGNDPLFIKKKYGPKSSRTAQTTVEKIIALRKKNYSIVDIKATLHAMKISLSVGAIDKILKKEGFASLPKRTKKERSATQLPQTLYAPKSSSLVIENETFTTEMNAGPLIFLPLLAELGIIDAIKKCNFPATKDISAVQYVLSFLALKLLGGTRWSHDTRWNFDRALGFFAGLNVLPKSTTLSTYSYRVTRQSNLRLLLELTKIFEIDGDGEFNLDFKAIPHWGDDSVLEKNWCGSRGKAIKSVLSVIAQNPTSGMLSYTNADIKHNNQNDAVLEFIDFWKNGHGYAPKMLVFDSKFTTYENLSKLNQDRIMFLTLRRRGKNIIHQFQTIPEGEWQSVQVIRAKKKKCTIKVYERITRLRNYDGEIREIIITDNGYQQPAFLITNDLNTDLKTLVKKYVRRWLVEKEIAEQVAFFQLNHPSSSIVIKVDFDLTLSLLAHNLYKKLAGNLRGFEQCTAGTIARKFLTNGALIQIKDDQASVQLKKKTHLPILLETAWMQKTTKINWLEIDIAFSGATIS